jgi:dienelactone hydrolase
MGTMRGRLVTLALLTAIAGCGGGGHGPVRLTTSPHDALLDAPLTIHATGLDPGSRTTLHASWRSIGGATWRSSTPVRADSHGTVTLRGAAAIGVLTRMRPPAAEAFRAPYFRVAVDKPPDPVRLELGGAPTSVLRRGAAPGVKMTILTVAHDRRAGYFFTAGGPRRHAAVVVLGGSEGGITGIQEAALLASHGHPALALGYFDEPGLPHRLGNIRLEYFQSALRWLSRRPGVDPHRLAISGVSRGSEAALLSGVAFPRLVRGVIALVPSSDVNDGLEGATNAWLRHGRPVAIGPIPVERIAGPVLTASAGEDTVWNSTAYAQRIQHRLAAHHVPYRPVALQYPRAGHGVGTFVPSLPTTDPKSVGTGGSATADAAGREDLWPRLLAFLDQLPRAARQP